MRKHGIIQCENKIIFCPPIWKTKWLNLDNSAELDLSSQKMGCVSKGMVQFFARTRRRMKNTLICELGGVNFYQQLIGTSIMNNFMESFVENLVDNFRESFEENLGKILGKISDNFGANFFA